MPITLYDLSPAAWRAASIASHWVALLTTATRFFIRLRRGQLLLDDYLVTIPATFCLWLNVIAIRGQDIAVRELDVFNFWTNSFAFFATVWTARITLCLGLGRLFPSHYLCRTYCRIFSAVLFALFLSLTLFYVLSCKDCGFGTRIDYTKCLDLSHGLNLGTFVFVIVDLISNSFMIVCPTYMVLHLKLPTDERRLMICLASSTIVTFLFSGLLTLFAYGPFVHNSSYNKTITMLSHFQASAALIVANILILIGFGFRLYRRTHQGPSVFYFDRADAQALGSLKFYYPNVDSITAHIVEVTKSQVRNGIGSSGVTSDYESNDSTSVTKLDTATTATTEGLAMSTESTVAAPSSLPPPVAGPVPR